jgi:hypothetical protein
LDTPEDGTQSHPIRYYLDEHIDPAVSHYLLAHHIDVLAAFQANRANLRISDADQLTYATLEHRVLVSRDKHFLNPGEVPQLITGQHAGIVAIRRTITIGAQARYLRYLAETETMETLAGQIRYYEPIPHGMFPDD